MIGNEKRTQQSYLQGKKGVIRIRLQNTCQLFQWFEKAKAMGQECRLHLSKAQRPEKQEKGRKRRKLES